MGDTFLGVLYPGKRKAFHRTPIELKTTNHLLSK